MNNKSLLLIILFISSCSSVDIDEPNKITSIDENSKFKIYLDNDWEKNLNENPLFASYVGDKRFNDKINSNSIKEFNDSKKSDLSSLSKLRQINESNLSDENKLNYKLKEFDLVNNIESKEFPIYFLRLNQRGGIQSFYETGNRLVYLSKEDYFDWFSRLEQFSQNIINSLEINKKGLNEGITQPRLVTEGVIAQIDALINSDIENNPYMKVFIEANENMFSPNEKNNLINDVKDLITNEINPAYKKLYDLQYKNN